MRIDVRALFGDIVSDLGGRQLDEELKYVAHKPKNADYLFDDPCMLIELKCLETDFYTDKVFIAGATKLYLSWAQRGLVPPPPPEQLGILLYALPQECRQEFGKFLINKIRDRIKDANRQIKETKKYLTLPAAQGMIIIVNDGNYMIQPIEAAGMLDQIFGKRTEYSNIDYYAYATVNDKVTMGEVNGFIWMQGPTRADSDDGRAEALAHRISVAMQRRIEKPTGIQLSDVNATEADLRRAKMVKHEHTEKPTVR